MSAAKETEPPTALSHLPEADGFFIKCLRLWVNGPETQAHVWNAFAQRYGTAEGMRALRAFERFIAAAAAGADRSLSRRAVCCEAVSADEVILAAMMRHAVFGETASASACAMLFARADAVDQVVKASAACGKCLLLGRGCNGVRQDAGSTVH